jgi:hypothetical protein
MNNVIKVKNSLKIFCLYLYHLLEINQQLQNLIYQNDITLLTINSFEQAFNYLDQLLPTRLSQIQEYCQSIEELELDRIRKVFFF